MLKPIEGGEGTASAGQRTSTCVGVCSHWWRYFVVFCGTADGAMGADAAAATAGGCCFGRWTWAALTAATGGAAAGARSLAVAGLVVPFPTAGWAARCFSAGTAAPAAQQRPLGTRRPASDDDLQRTPPAAPLHALEVVGSPRSIA